MSASGQSGPAGKPPDRLRTHAIELYCRELCGSDRMAAAAADAIRSISPADADGGDDRLLSVTRVAAASHAPGKASPRGLRGVLAAERESECDLTPGLLAERANGELPPSGQFKLENHLARCLFCRAAEVREKRASRAFSAVLATGDPGSRRATEPAEPPPQTTETLAEPVADAEPSVEPQPTTELPAIADAPPHATRGRRGLVVFPAGPAGAPAAKPRRRRASTRAPAVLAAYRPFLVTLALGAVVIVVLALALGGGASGQPSSASLPPPAAASTPPAAVGIAVTRSVNKPAPAGHRNPQPATPATPAATTTTSPNSSPAAQPVGAGTPTTP